MIESWAGLYDHHRGIRRDARRHVNAIRVVLRRLAEMPKQHRILPNRAFLHQSRSNGLLRLQLGQEAGGLPLDLAVLRSLPGGRRMQLATARLTILVLMDRRSDHFHMLTLMLAGKRLDETPWTCAIHLPDDRDPKDADRTGLGACSHPTLHCHVGPTLDHRPKVRVPLPSMPPARLLEWLISQIAPIADYEPVPWSELTPDSEPLR